MDGTRSGRRRTHLADSAVKWAIAAGRIVVDGRCATCDPICSRSFAEGVWSPGRNSRCCPSARSRPMRIGRRRGGLEGVRRAVVRHRFGALTRDSITGWRHRDGGVGGVGSTAVLDDLSRRVSVLAKRAATAPSGVGVVCHDAADYQSEAMADAPEDPSTTMEAQPGGPWARRGSSGRPVGSGWFASARSGPGQAGPRSTSGRAGPRQAAVCSAGRADQVGPNRDRPG